MSTSPDVVDLFALLEAAEGVTSPDEIERLKQRYADEIRQRYSGYGGLASLARSHGLGGFVDRYATSVQSSAEEEVRGKIKQEIMGRVRQRLAAKSTVTLTLTELARLWSGGSGSFDHAESFIFGGTPMRQCLEQVASRFTVEAKNLPADTPQVPGAGQRRRAHGWRSSSGPGADPVSRRVRDLMPGYQFRCHRAPATVLRASPRMGRGGEAHV